MTMIARAIRFALLTSFSLAVVIGAAKPAAAAEDIVARHSYNLLFGDGVSQEAAIAVLAERNHPDTAAILALALRYRRYNSAPFLISLGCGSLSILANSNQW